MYASSWAVEVLLVTSPERFGTRHKGNLARGIARVFAGHRYDLAHDRTHKIKNVHPILPRELRNSELFSVPLITLDTFNATAMSLAIQAKVACKHLMFEISTTPS